jgi:hypothetical protein
VPDARSDIFALGAICHEMLTGRAPFRGADELSLQGAILERQAPALDEVPVRLARTIAACLEKKPERRLQRIGLLLTQLRLHEIECRTLAASVRFAASGPDPVPIATGAESRNTRARVPLPAPEQSHGELDRGPAAVAAGTGYVNLIFGRWRCCPRCGSHDLCDSRPRDRFERGLVRAYISVLRCQRCFSRFVRAGVFRLEINEGL